MVERVLEIIDDAERCEDISEQKSSKKSVLEVDRLSHYPHTVIPPFFFERREKGESISPRTVFSVVTWDGRKVMSLHTEDESA